LEGAAIRVAPKIQAPDQGEPEN
jgi:hypothetical protein